MPYQKKLVGARCYLSPCCAEDAALWFKWDNDPEVTMALGDEVYTVAGLPKVEGAVAEVIDRQLPVFTIVDLATDRPIGRGVLFDVNPVDRRAMLGIVIGEKDCWGQGYGQDAVRMLLDYAFNLLNLNSVMLGTFAFNERALHCYRQVGFQEIGRRLEARIVGERRYDVVLMDLLAAEFTSPFVQGLVQ